MRQTWLTTFNQVYWAVKNEQYDTLERLIENGVDIDLAQNKIDRESEESQEEIDDYPESFFERFENTRAYMEMDGLSSFTPLAFAASLGLDNMVRCLLDHGADTEYACVYLCECSSSLLDIPLEFPSCPYLHDDDDMDEYSTWTPLHYAICNDHESTTKLLIARGASVQRLTSLSEAWGSKNVTALHVATRWGRESIINHLLDNDLVDINERSYTGATALHIAYVAENFSLVDKYLELGADINLEFKGRDGVPNSGWNIFAMACGEDRLDKALQYLQRGADPRFVIDSPFYREPWTAMRFIYEDRDTRSAQPTLAEVRGRVNLEQEILKVICGKPPAQAEI